MAGRKLAVTTIVPAQGHEEAPDGYLTLGPDSTVPDWAVDLIGDHCWADGGDETDKPRRGRPANKPADDK